MVAEPHRTTMGRIDDWCDEATFINWEQPRGVAELGHRVWPSGRTGLVVNLRFASSDNVPRSFPGISQPS